MLTLKVIPGASSTKVVGWLGTALKVRVSAPPEDGKANAAVECLLAEVLGLPARSVRIVSGDSSRHKVVEIAGMSKDEILLKIGSPDA